MTNDQPKYNEDLPEQQPGGEEGEKPDRQKAMIWWHSLTERKKESYLDYWQNKRLVLPRDKPEHLTGREIQMIWEKEALPSPTQSQEGKELWQWVKVENGIIPEPNKNIFLKCHYKNGDIIMGVGYYSTFQAPYWQTGIKIYGNNTEDPIFVEYLSPIDLPKINYATDFIPFIMYLTGYKEEQVIRIYKNWINNIKNN